MVVRTDHPIAKILRKLDLVGRIVSWSIELFEFGLRFEPRGLVHGQHLVDFVVELPSENTGLVRPWRLYIDGLLNKRDGGAGIVLKGPDNMVFK